MTVVESKTRPERSADPMRRARRRGRRLRQLPYWILAVIIAIGCLIWIYPFLWMLSASLKTQLQLFRAGLNLVPTDPQWNNYARAWNDAHFGRYMLNTAVITVATVVLVVVRCSLAGYALASLRFVGKKVVLVVLVATLFVPTGYTIIPVVQVAMTLHLLNSLAGIIVALAGGGHVAAILLYFGYFRKIPREITESALIDGAGFFSIFWRIMLPSAMPVTATMTVLTFMHTWNAFFLPLVFTFSRPDLRTLAVGMYAFVGENSTDWTGMAAAAVVSLAPVVILFFFLQRYFIEGIAGAVKQ